MDRCRLSVAGTVTNLEGRGQGPHSQEFPPGTHQAPVVRTQDPSWVLQGEEESGHCEMLVRAFSTTKACSPGKGLCGAKALFQRE